MARCTWCTRQPGCSCTLRSWRRCLRYMGGGAGKTHHQTGLRRYPHCQQRQQQCKGRSRLHSCAWSHARAPRRHAADELSAAAPVKTSKCAMSRVRIMGRRERQSNSDRHAPNSSRQQVRCASASCRHRRHALKSEAQSREREQACEEARGGAGRRGRCALSSLNSLL